MITIKIIACNPWQENTYILHDETKECIIIDSGCINHSEKVEIEEYISENELKVVKLVNTHLHIDHIFGIDYLKCLYKVDLHAHKDDEFLLASQVGYIAQLGVEGINLPSKIDQYFQDGDVVKFGNSELKVMHIAGHTPGGVVFYNPEQKFVISGDILFKGSIGRSDFEYGDYESLVSGISKKIMCLDDEVEVYPGHGEKTSIAFEKMNNPFL